jgi:hypothetical protein
MKNLHQEFPPHPPREKWDFSSCPTDERFTCLRYTCNQLAQEKYSLFADRLPPDWKVKYPQWPETPYLQIPEHERRIAQPELQPEKLRQKRASEVVPSEPIPAEVFDVFQSLIAIGQPPIYEHGTEAYALLKVPRGMAPHNLLAAVEAYLQIYHVPNALSIRPEGAGSYDRQFQAELNALTAYMLLETLTPEQATAVTAEGLSPSTKAKKRKTRLKRGLFSTPQKWLRAKARGEFLVKKTLEGQLTAVLLRERLASISTGIPPTKN